MGIREDRSACGDSSHPGPRPRPGTPAPGGDRAGEDGAAAGGTGRPRRSENRGGPQRHDPESPDGGTKLRAAMALKGSLPALALLSCALGPAGATGEEVAPPRWATHL